MVLISFSLAPILTNAQSRTINLEEAVSLAKKQNMELKNSQLNIESSRALVKTAWTLGETEFHYANGQINSELLDYNWNIKQDFGSPFLQSSV